MRQTSSNPLKRTWRIAAGLLMVLPSCRGFTVVPATNAHHLMPSATHLSSRNNAATLFLSSEISDERQDPSNDTVDSESSSSALPEKSVVQSFMDVLKMQGQRTGRRPPAQVEDFELVFYDIMLIINLSLSISFWATHRMDFNYIGTAVSEGCLMSLMWIGAGLYSGAFLYSAVDGHYGSMDERGGPKAAGLLGFQTFLNAVNLRLVFALVMAVLEHRPVGSGIGEDILPIEIGFGFVLMACWRALHSMYVPRM